jgi:hypothetical protein
MATRIRNIGKYPITFLYKSGRKVIVKPRCAKTIDETKLLRSRP